MAHRVLAAALPTLAPDGDPRQQVSAPLLDSSNGSPLLLVFSSAAFGIITIIAGITAVLYLIYSGILYITAGGSADKAKAARQGIINAIIGIFVITAAFAIIRLAISAGSGFNTVL